MIDDGDVNYAVTPNKGLGFNMPELVFAELIGFTFQQLRTQVQSPDNLIDQLFARLNADVRASIKTWIVEHPNLHIGLNYPQEDVAFPFIAIITEAEDEDENLAMLGDHGGYHVLGSLAGDATQGSVDVRKVGLSATTNVIVATDDTNLTMYLGALLRYVFLMNKDAFTRLHDVHNLRVSQSDLKWDESMTPQFCYMRALTLRYNSYFDINITTRVALIASLDLMVSTKETGVVVDVAVPNT